MDLSVQWNSFVPYAPSTQSASPLASAVAPPVTALIPYVLFAYRCSVQESTEESPFFMLYRRDPQLPTEKALTKPTERCYLDVNDYRSELVENISEVCDRESTENEKKKQKKNHDKRVCVPRFAVRDRVFVYKPSTKTGKV